MTPARRAAAMIAGAAVAVAGALAGCTPGGTGAAPAGSASTATASLPLTWEHLRLVDSGWSAPPEIRGDLFASYRASGDGPLEFSVIDAYGTVRWRAERPPSCTGFAVSTADDDPVVVLTDQASGAGSADPGASAWGTTAIAYDMATGQRRWGPVPVPGSVQGPGLVFGASAPPSALGATGPRIALDPATGAMVADEAAASGDDGMVTVVGEYDGTVLIARGGMLTARDAATREDLWSIDLPAGADGPGPIGRAAPPGAAVVDTGDGPGGWLIDLADGRVIATGVDAAGYEPLSQTWVWVSGRRVGADSVIHEAWQRELPEAPRIAAVGTGFLYLRYGGTVQVLNAVTGRDAQAYDDAAPAPLAVPRGISAGAAAAFEIGEKILLATVERPPD